MRARFGGRSLRLVENELSRLVLGGDVEPGDRVAVEVADGKLRFDVEKGVFERASEGREGRRQRQRVGETSR